MRFVDTNVRLYAVSSRSDEAEKAVRARELLRERDLALSVPVVRDFGDGRQGPGGHGQRPRQRYAAHAGFGGPLLVDQNESANY